MLDEYYQQQLQHMLSSLPCNLKLPPDQQDFFAISGETPVVMHELRCSIRTRIRTVGICRFESSIATLSRSTKPFKIFTRDISKNGFGIVSSVQIYPGEIIRILLPSFWVRIEARRCYRAADKFYEVGGRLESRHEPSTAAFDASNIDHCQVC